MCSSVCRVDENRTLVLYEHEECLLSGFPTDFIHNVEEFKTIPLDEVESISPFTIGRARGGGEVLRTNSYVGFAAISDYIVIVLPKIYRNFEKTGRNTNNGKIKAVMGFIHMLDYVYDMKLRPTIAKLCGSWRATESLHEAFLYIYAHELLNQLRRGIYKKYTRRTGEERLLRGKLILTQQLKKPPSRQHTLNTEYYLLSANNPLNRVLYYAASLGASWTKVGWTRNMLIEAKALLKESSDSINITADLSKVHFDRLNERFRTSYHLAKIILRGLGGLSGEKVQGFFVNMETLFEKYLYRVLERHLSHCRVWYQNPGMETNIVTTFDGKIKRKEQKPDITIQCGSHKIFLDAKYKNLCQDCTDPINEIDINDLRQMYIYSKLLERHTSQQKQKGLQKQFIVVLVYPYIKDGFNLLFEKNKLYRYKFSLDRDINHVLVVTGYDMEKAVEGGYDEDFIKQVEDIFQDL